MEWCDERYVKLYTRNTVTWMGWPWQARAVLPLLLRAAEGSGVIQTGNRDAAEAIGILVMVPSDVVRPALEALLADGTAEAIPGGILLPKYLEAQEATKTPAQRKRDQREKARAKARETTKRLVTRSHEESRAVTRSHDLSPSSPAQPSPPPAQPPTQEAVAPLPPRESDAVVAVYLEATGKPYLWSGAKDGKAFARLRAARPLDEICDAWRWSLRQPADKWHHAATVAQLASKWADVETAMAKAQPARGEIRAVEGWP